MIVGGRQWDLEFQNKMTKVCDVSCMGDCRFGGYSEGKCIWEYCCDRSCKEKKAGDPMMPWFDG